MSAKPRSPQRLPACVFIKMYLSSEGLGERDCCFAELALLTIPAATISTQIFTQTPSPGRAGPWCLCLILSGGEMLPGEATTFSADHLTIYLQRSPPCLESIIKQLSFLCRLNPFATNSKNL